MPTWAAVRPLFGFIRPDDRRDPGPLYHFAGKFNTLVPASPQGGGLRNGTRPRPERTDTPRSRTLGALLGTRGLKRLVRRSSSGFYRGSVEVTVSVLAEWRLEALGHGAAIAPAPPPVQSLAPSPPCGQVDPLRKLPCP
jgi:hypothetical protein